MKQKRLAVYLSIIILTIVLFVGTLVLKERSKNVLKPVTPQTETAKVLGLAELNLENQAVKSSEQLSQLLPRIPYARESLGRDDPFQMLPVESISNNDVSNDDLDLEPVYLIRGIMLGKTAMALVEENGVYRRVTVGDLYAGGRVTKINENSLILNRDGVQVIIKMGE